MNQQQAMALSLNAYFDQLISNIGMCAEVHMEQQFDVRHANESFADARGSVCCLQFPADVASA